MSLVFQTSELFQWEGPPPGEGKGSHSERRVWAQVRLTGCWEGPTGRCRGSFPRMQMWWGLEGQLLWAGSGGPCRDSCKGPQLASALPHPFSLARLFPCSSSGQQAP